MAFGKTAKQKAAEAQAKQQLRADQEGERQKAEFLASPVGQATTAKEQGQGFSEVQLQVGSSPRHSTIWGSNNYALAETKTATHSGTLAAIETLGWRLEHASYVFMITGESSRDKMVSTGQQTAVSGITVGIPVPEHRLIYATNRRTQLPSIPRHNQFTHDEVTTSGQASSDFRGSPWVAPV